MKMLACRLRLHGFLTFSSFVGVATIGGVTFTEYKPAPVIHNYPLMYAFAGLAHGSLASKSWSWSDPIKGSLNAPPPEYRLLQEMLRRFYIYPAKPSSIVVARMLGVVGGERLAHLQVRPKSMYPWRVVHHYFAPGSVFDTLVILYDEGFKLPRTIRLGAKRYGVFKVDCREAVVEGEWSYYSDPVNLDDVAKWGYRVLRSVMVLERKRAGGSLARALVDRPVKLLKARFPDGNVELKLPLPRRGAQA